MSYCTALAKIGAVVLLFCAEEEAFALLIMMLERVLPPQYFTKNSTDLRVDALVLRALAYERMPKLAAHCNALDIQLEQVFHPWLLNLFVCGMPMDTTVETFLCF